MILVAGGGPLAAAIERRLSEAGATVVRLRAGGNEAGLLAPEHLEQAAVLVLAADDDAGNVDLALQARRMRSALPLVVRLFDSTLASYLTETVPRVSVLSMSGVAAPVIADAARRVLAEQRTAGLPQRRPGGRLRRRRFRADRILVGALLSLLLLVFPSALFFSHALNLRYLDAFYFVWTTVMTVGYGDIALKDASDGVKLYGMALMLAGAGFIAVLFALLSDWVLGRRLDVLRGRTRVRASGHVLIAGAGNVALRITELLAGSGRQMVILERDAGCRNVAALSAAGHHVVIADAASEDMLELAGLDAAGLVLALTDVDAVNLQIALHARARRVPAILRMISPELQAHICARGDGIALSPVAAAAEAFARAALSSAAATCVAG